MQPTSSLGSPIWLGQKSSVATLAVERMYAYSGDRNKKGQYLYYGKTAGCVITGNEDGVKHCSMDLLYAMQHIGYVVPPQADCGWIGEAGPGPSYGDTAWNGQQLDPPHGYDNDFTNRNTTFTAWNLMHMARMLKDNGGIPAEGNVAEDWQHVTNAKSQNPEYHSSTPRDQALQQREARRSRRLSRHSVAAASRAERECQHDATHATARLNAKPVSSASGAVRANGSAA